ncbi:SUKH-3 domain-containing protein [Streptomyces sp. NPDC021139]|uniref:SUKH-3 domain-containing protein n=1 Tax=unclassified Streptomyces TaxID=2593676 RepID=UPI003402C66F
MQTGQFEMHEAARHFLAAFGALGVPHSEGNGSAPWMEFSLDPLLAIWDAEIIDALAEQAGVDLYPLGVRPGEPVLDHGGRRSGVRRDGQCLAAGRHP